MPQSQKYLTQKLWQNAINEANKLTNSSTDYWQQQGRDIVSQAQAEIDTINSQQEEVSHSHKETPQDLGNSSSNNTPTNSVSNSTKENLRDLGNTPSKNNSTNPVFNSTKENLRDLGNSPSNNDPTNFVPSPNQETFRDL